MSFRAEGKAQSIMNRKWSPNILKLQFWFSNLEKNVKFKHSFTAKI
jgi:ribosomal protein L28